MSAKLVRHHTHTQCLTLNQPGLVTSIWKDSRKQGITSRSCLYTHIFEPPKFPVIAYELMKFDVKTLVISTDVHVVKKIYMLRWSHWRLKYVGVQDRASKLCPGKVIALL